MDSISLSKLMDSLNVDRFGEEQLKIINKHQKVFTIIVKVEILIIAIYLISSFYSYSNYNEFIGGVNTLSLLCWFVLSIFISFNKSILKWKLKKTV